VLQLFLDVTHTTVQSRAVTQAQSSVSTNKIASSWQCMLRMCLRVLLKEHICIHEKQPHGLDNLGRSDIRFGWLTPRGIPVCLLSEQKHFFQSCSGYICCYSFASVDNTTPCNNISSAHNIYTHKRHNITSETAWKRPSNQRNIRTTDNATMASLRDAQNPRHKVNAAPHILNKWMATRTEITLRR
jgi:hypothetical protein